MHTISPGGSSSSGAFFDTLTPKKEGVEMESSELGDLLLLLLDDDLFPVETEDESCVGGME